VPLPALKNETRLAIIKVDLWWVTVYGPAKQAACFTMKCFAIGKEHEFSAENCFPILLPGLQSIYQELLHLQLFDPDKRINFFAITPCQQMRVLLYNSGWSLLQGDWLPK